MFLCIKELPIQLFYILFLCVLQVTVTPLAKNQAQTKNPAKKTHSVSGVLASYHIFRCKI